MVDSVEISRVSIKENLSVDVAVMMLEPDDWDFRPGLFFKNTTLSIRSLSDKTQLADVSLNQEQIDALAATRQVTLRVKFSVAGMHGRLNRINPIIADGKANLKLAGELQLENNSCCNFRVKQWFSKHFDCKNIKFINLR